MLRDKLFRGEIYCTACHQEGKRPTKNFWCDLYRMDDGTYQALCRDHVPKTTKVDEETGEEKEDRDFVWMREHLAMLTMCFHIPWRDVVKLTLHKPDPTTYDRKGDVVTVQMRDIPNKELMRAHAIEVLHGLQLMADKRATIHQWTEGTEQNDCWTDTNYFWDEDVTGTIRDKYWGEDRIKRFHKLCRVMAEIHEWELVDETIELLDRIAQALDKEEN